MGHPNYWLCFTEGLLTFISPCILPMLPIYLFYLAGTAENTAVDRGRLFRNALAFVLGLTLVFVALGATATALGSYLQLHLKLLRQISGLVMVAFGLYFMGLLRLPFLDQTHAFDYRVQNLNLIRSLGFGMAFAFGWTPCVGVFLGSALLLAGNTGSVVQGMLMLSLYSAGLGIPFLISAWLFESLKDRFRLLAAHSRSISLISGLFLVAAGLLLFLDRF
ncbi:MAG: cytochrome c biogenesis protein CcdA [Syntrophomonadaceae bacterium]|nr:cytochrome c biogenesis protein CcdA [Syntrophomonadaceae bacterium]